MNELSAIRKLSRLMSDYIYSMERPPASLNDLWLAWVERGHVPTDAEMRVAMKAVTDGSSEVDTID